MGSRCPKGKPLWEPRLRPSVAGMARYAARRQQTLALRTRILVRTADCGVMVSFTAATSWLSVKGFGRNANCWFSGRLFSNASSAYPETKMILRSGLRPRIAFRRVGPSISGITTSETTRSTAPFFSSSASSASTPFDGLDHAVAARAQAPRVQRAQALLVLDQKNCALPGEIGPRLWLSRSFLGRRRCRPWRLGLNLLLRMMARQKDVERGALVRPPSPHR